MTQILRDAFLSQKVQAHLSGIILNTLNAVAFVGYRNKNLDLGQYNYLKNDLEGAKYSDVTVVARLFRNRYAFTDSKNLSRNKTILSLGRNIKDDCEIFLKNNENQKSNNIKKLYNILRELDPLVQNLLYYRNFCSHNMKVVDQVGWKLAVIAGVVRTCEIALNDKSTYQLNSEIIEEFKSFASDPSGGFATSSAPEALTKAEYASNTPAVNRHDEKDLSSVYDKLDGIISELSHLTDFGKKLDKLISVQNKTDAISASQVPQPKETKILQSSETVEEVNSNDDEDASDSSYDDVNTITPEILRQRLQNISVTVKSRYQNTPGFGARTNLLQVANIGIILQREPSSLEEMLSFEEIRSRLDLSNPLILEQISEYGENLTDLFSNVLWESAFEFS